MGEHLRHGARPPCLDASAAPPVVWGCNSHPGAPADRIIGIAHVGSPLSRRILLSWLPPSRFSGPVSPPSRDRARASISRRSPDLGRSSARPNAPSSPERAELITSAVLYRGRYQVEIVKPNGMFS